MLSKVNYAISYNQRISYQKRGNFDNVVFLDEKNVITQNELIQEDEQKRIVTLWRSVINQALSDLSSRSKKKEYIKNRNNAKKWLLSYEQDFFDVCMFAELDPYLIISKAWKIINR